MTDERSPYVSLYLARTQAEALLKLAEATRIEGLPNGVRRDPIERAIKRLREATA